MNKKNMQKSGQNFGQILGIRVISTSTSSVLMRVEEFISHNSKFSILTPNPELILMAQSNKKLKGALNSADLSIPDGVGLKLADPSLNIIKGRELFVDLIKLANRKGWKVFLLGGLDGEAELAAKKLKVSSKRLKVETFSGPRLNEKAEPVTEIDKKLDQDAIRKINEFAPDLLFVAFGNPTQEIWVHKNVKKLNAKGVMAVGGAFRYIAGMSKLPPKWMEALGLEWLWRLITEPARAGRVFRATIVFPIKVLLHQLQGK